jgi:hypothetical protein
MKIQGRISNAKYRNGTKQNSGEPWECVDYYLVEVDAQQHRSEFPFTLFNQKMREYALHIGAEGEFDVQVTNEVRNGYNNIRVFVNGFKGKDGNEEKALGSYASDGQPNSVAEQPKTAVNAGQAQAFDPTNGGFGASAQEEKLPFD